MLKMSNVLKCSSAFAFCGAIILGARLISSWMNKKGNVTIGTTPLEENISNSDSGYVLYIVDNTKNPYGRGSQYNELLLKYIRHKMTRPNKGGLLQISHPKRKDFSQYGQSSIVDKLLNKKRNGIFFEGGAYDGEIMSTTLFFERERNWTGVLMEPHPLYLKRLLKKRRNAYVLPYCISTSKLPMIAMFRLKGWALLSHRTKDFPFGAVQFASSPEFFVLCFPLNAILEALKIKHVDYMSLDIEGSELDVLNAIDWTKITVDVLQVEIASNLTKLREVRRFFSADGYLQRI